MRHLVHLIIHEVGDCTAVFMYPIFGAFFDALYDRHHYDSLTDPTRKS